MFKRIMQPLMLSMGKQGVCWTHTNRERRGKGTGEREREGYQEGESEGGWMKDREVGTEPERILFLLNLYLTRHFSSY